MKFSMIICALSALTSASALLIPRQNLPSCASACLASANLGGCDANDDTCLCNTPAFVDSTASCIASTCTGSDLAAADSAAEQLCLAVGVTLTTSSIPSATSGASGSSSATSATSSAAPSKTNGAVSNGVNTFAALAAFGFVAVAL